MTYFLFVLGLVGLFLGGEFLIRGAVGVAHRLHVPPLIIGLTIVGFGTSTPELLVSLQAARAGVPSLALGNVIGSNIANILLILGVTALIMPVPLQLRGMRRDFAVMIGATLALWAILIGETITRPEGAVLVMALVIYLATSFLRAAGPPRPDADAPVPHPIWKSLGTALAGFIILLVGAHLLVGSATEIARSFGVSEAVIGLSIVAVGTSLPELATSVLAAFRGHPEIGVGNILGSCIFNILGILGITALYTPIPVAARFAGLDIGLALAAGVAMLGFAAFPARVGRWGGAGLLLAYASYLTLLDRI